MKRFVLMFSLLGWALCNIFAQNITTKLQTTDRASSLSTEQMKVTTPENVVDRPTVYANEIPQNGLVVDYVRQHMFRADSALVKLPQKYFDAVKNLERGTIAIDLSIGDMSPNLQLPLSVSSQSSDEFFGVCLNENDHFGIRMKYSTSNGGYQEDYYSGAGLAANFHQTILITMDPTGRDALGALGGMGAYSFYVNGTWQKTVNVRDVKKFGIFKSVKDADGIYLGGVKSQNGEKKHGFVGAIHSVRVWNRVLSADECKNVTGYTIATGQLLFESKKGGAVPYRIPALAQAANGNLIAVADYRKDKWDIGNGRIDLQFRISEDRGHSWGRETLLIQGTEAMPYSDAAIVADRKSSEVLILCASGTVAYTDRVGKKNEALKVMAIRSHNFGSTWETPVDITDQFMGKLTKWNARKLFIASGRIVQSKHYNKSGQYQRLYCVALVKDANNNEFNAAFYSDDFGATWDLLGGDAVMPIPIGAGANEAKALEMPDGSVLISARNSAEANSGRIFNLFNYTDGPSATGFWSGHAYSNRDNNGISIDNSTNGDILCVPVIRKSDSQQMYLLLQSLPLGERGFLDFSNKREKMGIYYKPLLDLGDFFKPENVAKDWEGKYKITDNESAYSVMVMQDNNTLGLVYEDGYNAPVEIGKDKPGYNLFYQNYSIEEITGGKYYFNANIDRKEFVKKNIDCKKELLTVKGRFVGQLSNTSPEATENLDQLIQSYREKMSDKRYNAINEEIDRLNHNAPRIVLTPHHVYRMISKQTGYELASNSTQDVNVQGQNIKNIEHYFTVVDAGSNQYYVQHMNRQWYLGKLRSTRREKEFKVLTTPSTSDAGKFTVVSQEDGNSTLECMNPVEAFEGFKFLCPQTSSENSVLIAWESGNRDWIKWNIEPIYVHEVALNGPVDGSYWSSLYLPFAVRIPEGFTAYIGQVHGKQEYMSMTAVKDVPAETGFILVGNAKTATLPIVYKTTSDVANNEFQGTLTEKTVPYLEYYTLGNGSEGMGLYHPRRIKGDNNNAKIPANKAFVPKTAENAQYLVFNFDGEMTDIEEVETDIVETEEKPVVYYDLSGRRVAHPTHGIYIANGRKVYIP